MESEHLQNLDVSWGHEPFSIVSFISNELRVRFMERQLGIAALEKVTESLAFFRAEEVFPSPWREGRGEGERFISLIRHGQK
jgi:hypothetical protein